ncbi:hypothetical protein T4C_386 [Trichinella pseudospiralis]|uniref:Uncharacterized protein n=1 Tax=Trichinella pseudospiralis TaxID=6337 RepID=A0A0V1JND2_TRIPS|nr:hypothetical protein T4C_386 [Trichinella pseudospiralis]
MKFSTQHNVQLSFIYLLLFADIFANNRSLYNYSLKTNGRTSSPGNLLFIFQASLQQIHYYIANIILKNEASIEEFFGSLFFYHINMTLRLETFGLFNLKLLHLFYDESELNFCKKNFFAASINLE